MPNRKEVQDVKPSPKPGSSEPARSRVRIGRACDRCKIKKSKCDGNTPCSACIAAESICEYSARRRREARDWQVTLNNMLNTKGDAGRKVVVFDMYLGMQDVIDEALQRLYWACREGRGFPGVVPDESGGRVSTDAILRGLGLSPPTVDNTRLAGHRADSVLDTQAQLHLPQSYRPLDFPAPNLSRTKTTSSAMTPISTASDDRLTLVEAAADGAGRRGKRTSAMEVDGEEEDDMSDGLPDGLGQQFQERMGGSIDPAMLQDGHVDLMDASMYPDMSVMNFEGGVSPSTRGRPTHMQAAAGQSQVDGLPQERYGSGDAQGWEGQDPEVGGMLPWPGNMASVYRRPKHDDGRSGFDDLVDGERRGIEMQFYCNCSSCGINTFCFAKCPEKKTVRE